MNKFKVGELVEQILVFPGESSLCEIISIHKECNVIRIEHRHINKETCEFGYADTFKRIPKLRRLLKYGV